MLDLSAADPTKDYLAALELLEDVADDVKVFVPGHGSVGDADQLRARIKQDRTYVQALRDGGNPDDDPRLSAAFGKDWLPDVHGRQAQRLAERREHKGTSK
jgi:glyoxylase-like metal-dependent hydrolase (beta-lactamase superfamily II)